MAKPSNKKDVMKLTGMMAALGRFISKLGEKGLPFLKLLKKADKFVWDDKAQKAFESLKEFLTTPPIMTPPIPKETLLLYISATTNVVSTVLVTEREEEGQAYAIQRPVYYVSEVLADAKNTLYTTSEVALCAPDYVEKAPPLLSSSQDRGTIFVSTRRNHPQPRRQRPHCQVVSQAWRV
jgi:dsDNA-binding SOS-regulon protein